MWDNATSEKVGVSMHIYSISLGSLTFYARGTGQFFSFGAGVPKLIIETKPSGFVLIG